MVLFMDVLFFVLFVSGQDVGIEAIEELGRGVGRHLARPEGGGLLDAVVVGATSSTFSACPL